MVRLHMIQKRYLKGIGNMIIEFRVLAVSKETQQYDTDMI